MTRDLPKFLILLVLSAILFVSCSEKTGTGHAGHEEGEAVEYWTCSMHPSVKSDKPGSCPICHMDLIPVKIGDRDRIVVSEETAKKIGLTSSPAVKREIHRVLRLPGRVAEDPDLYLAEQEYLSARTGDRNLLSSARLKLDLAGYTPAEIRRLEKDGKPDRTLVYPGRTVWVTADVSENDLALLRPGQKVRGLVLAWPGRDFTGTVAGIAPRVNEMTRSAAMRIRFLNPDKALKLGMYVHIELHTSFGTYLSVPSEAVIDTGSRQVVYTDLGEGRYQMRQITAGFSGINTDNIAVTAILDGLKAGEMVVVKGNFLLDSQSTLTSGSSQLYGAGEEINAPPAGAEHRH